MILCFTMMMMSWLMMSSYRVKQHPSPIRRFIIRWEKVFVWMTTFSIKFKVECTSSFIPISFSFYKIQYYFLPPTPCSKQCVHVIHLCRMSVMCWNKRLEQRSRKWNFFERREKRLTNSNVRGSRMPLTRIPPVRLLLNQFFSSDSLYSVSLAD